MFDKIMELQTAAIQRDKTRESIAVAVYPAASVIATK